MTTLTVQNHTFQIPENYVSFFEKHLCCSLQDMAEIYLCTEFKSSDIEQKLQSMSDAEIYKIIRSWGDVEFAAMGVSYGDIQ